MLALTSPCLRSWGAWHKRCWRSWAWSPCAASGAPHRGDAPAVQRCPPLLVVPQPLIEAIRIAPHQQAVAGDPMGRGALGNLKPRRTALPSIGTGMMMHGFLQGDPFREAAVQLKTMPFFDQLTHGGLLSVNDSSKSLPFPILLVKVHNGTSPMQQPGPGGTSLQAASTSLSGAYTRGGCLSGSSLLLWQERCLL
jgi:hypothetical protein